MNSGTIVVGYCRVSTAEQATNGVGLDAQESAIRDECSRRGWLLLDVIRDEGASGKTLERPGLRRALERIAAGEASGLVTAKLDRATRSVADLGELLEWLAEAGASFVALDVAIDTSTPAGRLMANVLGSVAEWERDIIGQRTKDGLAAVRAKGGAISRPAVWDRPELVRRIRRLRERGYTLRAIADRLNRDNVPTLRGASEWRASSVQAAAGYTRRPKRRARVDLPPIPARRKTR